MKTSRIAYSTAPEYKRAYFTRSELKSACNNPNHNNYKHQGALGISYDKRWHDFENFLDDVGNAPTDEHILIRLDSTIDWCKSNCEWQITGTARASKEIDINDELQVQTYAIWNQMKGKCNNPKHLQYSEVGAKGITYSMKWYKFSNFITDMGFKPSSAHSFLRHDKSGNYTEENCSWSTDKISKSVVNVNHDAVTFNCWQNMKQRCDNPNNTMYKYYGARGIAYSEEFFTYEGFYAAVGKRPSEQYSLDRIDVNGNYCRENCRWATDMQQANNTTRNIVLTYNNKTQTAVEWSRELGVDEKMIYSRLKLGWSTERALTERSAVDGHVFLYNGTEYNMKQLCETFNITDASIRGKRKRGKTITEIIDEKIFDDRIDAIVLKYGRTVAYIRTKLKAGSTLDDIIAHYERLANK